MRRSTLLLTLLSALADAQRGYNSYDEMAQAQMMYRQQQEQAAKAAQAQRQRELQAQQQAALLQQARQQALYEQHLRADQQNRAGSFPSTPQNSKKPRMSAKEKKAHEKRQKELDAQKKKQLKELDKRRKLAVKAAGRSRGGERGLLGRVFSLKGLVLLGGVGYLYVAQRQLLAALVLKPVALLVKAVWAVAIKPILRKSSPALAARTAAAAASSRAATEAGPAAGMDADVRISHEGGASGGAARAERCDCPIPESLVNLEGRARVVVTNHRQEAARDCESCQLRADPHAAFPK
eukprot:CAMPEP_0196689264 /NCGR_PEP_ID=MMETSP1090-20130531/17755_1 /TAXON_ID=37098 /ORGANISM="Isochrysis sp, Strain CCMP1244" /LENGTH=293 /DNA_ID=CAMNT_0042028243 /DNA_START=109 /DNA_END=992 /DNA_ORIENTATION=+